MAICIEQISTENHSFHTDGYNDCNAFDNDFYKCLCEDLAKELDFPAETDLSRISQLELFGTSWQTDPYKQLLLRCLDHSLPRLREPFTLERRESFGSINFEEDIEEGVLLPTNPPPSPAMSATNYVLSGSDDKLFDMSNLENISTLGLAASTPREPMLFDKVELLPQAAEDNVQSFGSNVGCKSIGPKEDLAQEVAIERLNPTRRQSHHRVASTGLLATVVTGDGSITWHFKEL